MPVLIDVSIPKRDIARFTREFSRLPRAILSLLHRITKGDMVAARTWMIQHKLTGRVPTISSLATRSGRLIKSLRTEVKYTQTGEQIDGVIARTFISDKAGTERHRPHTYGPVHEYGAIIRSQRADGYLAIPLRDEAVLRSPRRIAGLFPHVSKKGNLLLVKYSTIGKSNAFGKGSLTVGWNRIIPYFLLKKEVRIPPRPFMQPTADMWFPIVWNDVDRSMGLLVRGFFSGTEDIAQ